MPTTSSASRRRSRASDIVLAKGEIESPGQPELRRRTAWHDARDAVIAETRRPAEHEGVARFERSGLDRVATAYSAKQKSSCVANRHRDHRQSRGYRSRAFILVLMHAHAPFGVVMIQDAQ